MATNKRRRERYATDEDYRQRRLRETRDKREAAKAKREEERRLRGWLPIHSVPDHEAVMLFDPLLFWPVTAWLDKDGQWQCINYNGPEPHPTHWRPLPRVPLM